MNCMYIIIDYPVACFFHVMSIYITTAYLVLENKISDLTLQCRLMYAYNRWFDYLPVSYWAYTAVHHKD